MVIKYLFIFLLVLTLIPLSSAELQVGLGGDGEDDIGINFKPVVIPFNNNTAFVNRSTFSDLAITALNWFADSIGLVGDADPLQFSNVGGTLTILDIYCQLTGCTMSGDLDMGDNAITKLQYIDFNLTANVTSQEGRIAWDDDDKTLNVGTDINGVTLQVGQEIHLRVTNKAGRDFVNGNVVFIDGVQGQRPTIDLAISNDTNRARLIGILTHDCINNANCIVTTNGIVRDLDLSSFSAGDVVWLSGTEEGNFTNIMPVAPNFPIMVGIILNPNANSGNILVATGPTDVVGNMVIYSLTINTNLNVTGNSSADWFKGLFNWTSGDDWNIFDGSTLTFNETHLNKTIHDWGFNETDSLTIFYDERYLTGELSLFFYNSTDPHNSSYTIMNTTIPRGAEQRDSFENLVNGDNLLTKRILSTLNLSILEKGAYNQHTTIDYTSGNKDISLRSELYILYDNGTETLIGQSPPSIGLIIGIYQQIIWTGVINEDIIFPEGSHLTMYLYATVVGSGQAPDIDLVVGADTAARLDIGINPTDIKTIEVDPFAIYKDGSKVMTGNLDMGSNGITNVATLDNGGSPIVVNDDVDLGANSLSTESVLLIYDDSGRDNSGGFDQIGTKSRFSNAFENSIGITTGVEWLTFNTFNTAEGIELTGTTVDAGLPFNEAVLLDMKLAPKTFNAEIDLGATGQEWRDLFLSGTIDLGTNTITDGIFTGDWTFDNDLDIVTSGANTELFNNNGDLILNNTLGSGEVIVDSNLQVLKNVSANFLCENGGVCYNISVLNASSGGGGNSSFNQTLTDSLYGGHVNWTDGAGAIESLTTTGDITIDSDSSGLFLGDSQNVKIYNDGSTTIFESNDEIKSFKFSQQSLDPSGTNQPVGVLFDFRSTTSGVTNLRGAQFIMDLKHTSGTQDKAIGMDGVAKTTNNGAQVNFLTGLNGAAELHLNSVLGTRAAGVNGIFIVLHGRTPTISGAQVIGVNGAIDFLAGSNPTTSASTKVASIMGEMDIDDADLGAAQTSIIYAEAATIDTGSVDVLAGLFLEEQTAGDTNWQIFSEAGDWILASDNDKIFWGASQPSFTYWDGTNQIWNTTTGFLEIRNNSGLGKIRALEYATSTPKDLSYSFENKYIDTLPNPNNLLDADGKIKQGALRKAQTTWQEKDPDNCWQVLVKTGYCYDITFLDGEEELCFVEQQNDKDLINERIVEYKTEECGTKPVNVTLIDTQAFENTIMISELKQENQMLKDILCIEDKYKESVFCQ